MMDPVIAIVLGLGALLTCVGIWAQVEERNSWKELELKIQHAEQHSQRSKY